MRKSTDKVRTAAETARPYVERAITDEEFRESLRAAFVAAKQIYDELMPPKGVTGLATKVAKDEDVHESIKRAVVELRNAADRIQDAEKESHGFRNVLLILIGVAIGIFFNPFTGPETRRWVKGRVSGGEFSYNGQEQAETVTAVAANGSVVRERRSGRHRPGRSPARASRGRARSPPRCRSTEGGSRRRPARARWP